MFATIYNFSSVIYIYYFNVWGFLEIYVITSPASIVTAY